MKKTLEISDRTANETVTEDSVQKHRNDSDNAFFKDRESSVQNPSGEEDIPHSESCSSSATSGNRLGNRQLLRHKTIFLSLILLLGACAAGAFVAIGSIGAIKDQESLFIRRADTLVGNIESSWGEYESFGLWIHENCRSVDYVSAQPEKPNRDHGCSREEFRELYEYILSVGIEFQSAQFMPNVTHANRVEAEEEARAYYAEHYPEVNYRGITGLEPLPEGGVSVQPRIEQPFYFPVHRVEPVEGNEAAIELDIYSSGIQRSTLDKAVSTWKPALTDRLKLVQDTDPNAYSVILHHPGVQTSHILHESPRGLSLMVIRIIDLIRGAVGPEPTMIYAYDMCTKGNDESPTFLGAALVGTKKDDYKTLPEMDLSDLLADVPRSTFVVEKEIHIADRTWKIVILKVEGTYQPNILFIVLGGSFIIAATLLLEIWFFTSLKRVAKMNRMRAETEREKAALIVQNVRQQALAERELNDFVAHEVRNPLSSAIAALSFVTASVQEAPGLEGRIGETIREDISIVGTSLQFINELLRNMLDMHRAANKQMKVIIAPSDLLEDVCIPTKNMLYLRGNKKIEVLIECPPHLMVETDRLRLKQIALNLANNSLKFVESGFIRIRALVVDNNVRLQIEDSGPGIPLEKRAKLFAKFQDSLDQLSQGTGIGLNLCKNLALLMDGDLWLDETYHSGISGCPGSCFVVDLKRPPLPEADKGLPYQVPIHVQLGHDESNGASNQSQAYPVHLISEQDLEAQPVVLPKSLSVLFTDDDTMIRRMFTRSLLRVAPEWQCDLASNGETAVCMAAEKEYDIIFLDQYMASIQKQMLGTETARALRSQGCNSIICGLSANDVEDQFIDNGADFFMLKPFHCKKDEMEVDLIRLYMAGKHRLPLKSQSCPEETVQSLVMPSSQLQGNAANSPHHNKVIQFVAEPLETAPPTA